MATEFINKISKAFVDTLYAFLDGMVNLASEERPVGLHAIGERGDTVQFPAAGALNAQPGVSSTTLGANAFDQLDLTSIVGVHVRILRCYKLTLAPKDTRTILVLSNIGYLRRSLIPSMISQLETAFNTTIEAEKQVRDLRYIRACWN